MSSNTKNVKDVYTNDLKQPAGGFLKYTLRCEKPPGSAWPHSSLLCTWRERNRVWRRIYMPHTPSGLLCVRVDNKCVPLKSLLTWYCCKHCLQPLVFVGVEMLVFKVVCVCVIGRGHVWEVIFIYLCFCLIMPTSLYCCVTIQDSAYLSCRRQWCSF